MSAGFGQAPIDPPYLLAAGQLLQIDLDPFEAECLLEMSGAYYRGLKEGEDPFSIAPNERKDS